MKVMLTGASGFIGQATLKALRQRGIEAVAVSRRRPQELAGAFFLAADLLATSDFEALAQAAGATHLMHLAWVTEPGKYEASALNFRWVDASLRLVQAFCANGGRHVVVAGTSAEYDWDYGRCQEDQTPLCPANVYGASKDATRRLVEAVCAQYQAQCAWARVFFPFGAGESRLRLVPALLDALQGRSGPFGVNAQSRRDFLHVDDVARGLLALLQPQAAGSYNVSSGDAVAIGDLVRVLAQLLNQDPQPLLELPSLRSAYPPLLVGENKKLKALGWQPERSLTDGLEQMLHDLRLREQYSSRGAVHGA